MGAPRAVDERRLSTQGKCMEHENRAVSARPKGAVGRVGRGDAGAMVRQPYRESFAMRIAHPNSRPYLDIHVCDHCN